MSESEDIPVHFRYRGQVYRGAARFDAGWHHIKVLGRLVRTGGWDYMLATKEMGDDKWAIAPEQYEALRVGRSIEVEFGSDPVTVLLGEYVPPKDDRTQGELFGQ